jgi:hypothetical protein
LIVHKFRGGSKGLASPAELEVLTKIAPAPQGTGLIRSLFHWVKERRRVRSAEPERDLPAVCIPPGAKLYLEGITPTMCEAFGFGEAEEVTFTELTMEPFRYRDAFRFKNGAEILVQRFPEGMLVEVLALALAEDPEEEQPEVEELAPAVARLIERSFRANA